MSRDAKQIITIYSLALIAIVFTVLYISSTIEAMTQIKDFVSAGDTLNVSDKPINNTNINPQANQTGGAGADYELQPAAGYKGIQ